MSLRRALPGLLALLLASPATAEPLRVASLVPFVSEAVPEWPGRAVLVAAVRRQLDEPAPAAVVDLGSPHQPNLEPLVLSRPDLIVADERLHALLRPRLEAMGAEVLMVRAESVAATFEGLRMVARRAGAEPLLESRVTAVEKRLAALAVDGHQSVLPLFGAPGSFLLITPRTWLGDLLARLGVTAERTSGGKETLPGYVQLADEVLAASRPDHVLLLAHGSPEVVTKAFSETWGRLGHGEVPVHVLDPRLFATNPGLRMAEAAEAVIALLAEPSR